MPEREKEAMAGREWIKIKSRIRFGIVEGWRNGVDGGAGIFEHGRNG